MDYRYPDGALGLSSVSFRVTPGEAIAILGANSAGKTTLLRILNGLQLPSSGSITFRNQTISQNSLEDPKFRSEFRQAVSFIPQQGDCRLVRDSFAEAFDSGQEAAGLGLQISQRQAETTYESLGIGHVIHRAQNNLSGSERMRVAIASVLITRPEVVMFDEPFLGLDPIGQVKLVRVLNNLQSHGKTTLIATHTLDFVPRIAKRALVLGVNHELIADDTVDKIYCDERVLALANLIENYPGLSL